MNIDIPNELLVLAHRLRTQDNLATGEPLFCVQQRVRFYGLDPRYADSEDLCLWRHSEDWEATYDSFDEILDEEVRDWRQLLDHEPTEEETEAFIATLDDVRDSCEAREDVVLPGGSKLEITFYQQHWEFVTAHFSRAAAEHYMHSNMHHFRHGARIYVTSQYRCHEWNAVRKLLMTFPDPPGEVAP